MRDYRGTIIETAKAQLAVADPFVWLIELEVPTEPPTRFRITNYNSAINYGVNSSGQPIVYSPFPVAQGELREHKGGDLADLTINVANVTLELMDELEQYNGLVDQAVRLRLVNASALNDPNAQNQQNGKITRCIVRDEVATFTIGTTNLTKTLFPKNRILALDCQFRFGGPECGYMIPAGATNVIGGGFNVCGRTFEDCGIRGDDEVARALTRRHPLRFGGCPGTKAGRPK